MKYILAILMLCWAIIVSAQTDNVRRKHSQKQTTTQSATNGKSRNTQASTAKKSKSNNSVPKPTLGTSTYTPDVIGFSANGVYFQMVEVQGGTFTMGATSEQVADAMDNEKPAHKVTLSDYYIGKTEVTQALWEAVMGKTLSQIVSEYKSFDTYGVGDNYPMYYISWKDCQEFIKKLNSLTGKNFRLPTEAEWEYAARGGSKSRGYKYSGSNSLRNVAWYGDNSDRNTHEVGTKRPNELGIYDMSGNVWEWCSDMGGKYSGNAQTNPKGPDSGFLRVYRGGCFFDEADNCRSSRRFAEVAHRSESNVGFRLCLSK